MLGGREGRRVGVKLISGYKMAPLQRTVTHLHLWSLPRKHTHTRIQAHTHSELPQPAEDSPSFDLDIIKTHLVVAVRTERWGKYAVALRLNGQQTEAEEMSHLRLRQRPRSFHKFLAVVWCCQS